MAAPLTRAQYEEMKAYLSNIQWRLDNLYHITDKFAKKVIFKDNAIQKDIADNLWFNTVILKSRQRGVSSGFMKRHLDDALFIPNYQIGVIAHKTAEAVKLVNRARYAYDNLPGWLQDANPIERDNKQELTFRNGSSIYASTSYRGGNVQKLHITEMGYICAKYPEKGDEIVSGALQAVPVGGYKIIESTALGRSGYFYDYVETARKNQEMNIPLNKMSYKLLFYPFYTDPDCRLDPTGVATSPRHEEYFNKLQADTGVILSPETKAFWIMKESEIGPKIKSEYPGTINDAFELSLDGAYYAQQMTRARLDGRITKVPYVHGVPVNTAWDIAKNDNTAIWFYQKIGREYHIIDFCTNNNEGFEYFYNIMNAKQYIYGYHVFPFDIENGFQMKGIVTRWGTVQELFGARNCRICPNQPPSREDGINAARKFISMCQIDRERCEEGIDALDNYSKKWDARSGCYREEPLHNEFSDPADSFRYMAVYELIQNQLESRRQSRASSSGLGSKRKPWGPAYT